MTHTGWGVAFALCLSAGVSAQSPEPLNYHGALQQAKVLSDKGDSGGVIRILAPWLEQHADQAELQHRLGLAYFQRQDYPKAIRHLSIALKLEAKDSAAWKQTAENLGLAYYFTNRARDALPLLEGAVARNPADTYLRYSLAMTYVYVRDRENAQKAFAQLFGLAPDSPQASLLTSHFMARENFVSDAEALIRQAQKAQPDLPDAHYRLGVIALTNGRTEDAVSRFKKELSANPGHPMAWHYLGYAYTQLGKSELAVDPLQRAIWLNLRNTPSYILLASVYSQQEEYSLAETALKRALELAPQDYEVHFQLARIYYKTNRPELAKKEMEIARRLRKGDGAGN